MREEGGDCLLLIFFLLWLTGDAMNPGCQCIRFRSTFGKEWGQFSSPDYPVSGSLGNLGGIGCLLYSFQGPEHSIVELRLDKLDIPTAPSSNNNTDGCSSGYLKLFLHLEGPGVSELTPWNSLLCGHKSNLTHFSASNRLVLQFHLRTLASTQISSAFGFTGRFRFLNSSQYESSGRLVGGTKCDYLFESTNYSAPEGRLFSPNYPSSYPHNSMCTYIFRAKDGERVEITFETVGLEPGLTSCLNKTDIIRVHDGSSSRSPVIALICNPSQNNFQVASSGSELFLQFIGNSGSPGPGFRAKFHFIKVIYEWSLFHDPSGFNLQQYFPKSPVKAAAANSNNKEMTNNNPGVAPQASTLVPKCDSRILSDWGKGGTVTSPNYPQTYPPLSHCRIDFIGSGRQRVALSFVDFHLSHSQKQEEDTKCTFSDTISAFVYLRGTRTQLGTWCGPHPPPNLMSSDHRLSLEFEAKSSLSRTSFRGFYAQYNFIEDLGGLSPQSQLLLDYPCAFVFNISLYENGSLWSPNWPGPYPRDTECHYFFHGNSSHSVHLEFAEFDIPGQFPQCDERGDYLEYSEHMPTDGRFARLCGHQEKKSFTLGPTQSGSFFRLGFRSSDGLNYRGSSGFHVLFTFTSRQINHGNRLETQNCVGERLHFILLVITNFTLLILVQ